MNQPQSDRELLAAIARRLVDHPEDVRVEEARDTSNTYLRLLVAPQDRGQILGREGKTAQALRVLFGRIAAVDGRKTFLELTP